ncbi:hypothetical protein MJO28_005434 [Puccinia striiformis f. sp. tritici]|uniref:Uncharacterized protein n=1 Tax=Puccinia striiformis f. sp. tritici TaxID=168172 RepID=A0ACC0EKP6_9BASI|nr:hypothetical protein MJO28_005434 [Puccinia striiformis f. sp. tritici]
MGCAPWSVLNPHLSGVATARQNHLRLFLFPTGKNGVLKAPANTWRPLVAWFILGHSQWIACPSKLEKFNAIIQKLLLTARMAMSSLPDFIPGRTIPQLKGLKHKSQAVVPVSHFKRLATLFKTRQLQTSLKHERWDLMAEGLFLMIITSDSELQIEDSIHESQSVTSSRIHGSQAVTKGSICASPAEPKCIFPHDSCVAYLHNSLTDL